MLIKHEKSNLEKCVFPQSKRKPDVHFVTRLQLTEVTRERITARCTTVLQINTSY